jgi:undecaprenyl-diphosphatase
VVATLTSVAGAIVGAWLGARAGRPLLVRFRQEKNLARLEVLLERHGTVGVLIAGFTPIPYKVMGWAAGMGKMEMRPFVLAGLASRGLRFGLEIVLVVQYGSAALDAIKWILDREILLAVVMVAVFLAAWVAWRWWESLTPEALSEEA